MKYTIAIEPDKSTLTLMTVTTYVQLNEFNVNVQSLSAIVQKVNFNFDLYIVPTV